MISAKLVYVVYPQKSKYEANDYIIAKFSTYAENVPVIYRNGKKMIDFTAKGKGIILNKKFNSLLLGKWNYNDKYGNLELYVEKSDIELPSDKDGIVQYLITFLDGCGPKTATKIYDKFGQSTLLVLNSAPEKLLEIQGIRKRQLQRMLKSYYANKCMEELAVMLTPYGVNKNRITLVHNVFGEKAVEIIKNNPFKLLQIRGFTFDLMDTLSAKFGCDPNNPDRIKAAVIKALKLAQGGSHIFNDARLYNGGNLFVNQYTLRDATKSILDSRSDSSVSTVEINTVLWQMYNDRSLLGENGNVYLPINYYQEQKIAQYIAEILNYSKTKRYSDLSCKNAIQKSETLNKIKLSKNQKTAISMVLQNPLSIITGGAGTGKTTVLKNILTCLNILGENMDDVILAAPTGKAAILMSERTGHGAPTIHKALGLVTDSDFYKDETEISPIDGKTIVCDEFSMADTFLTYRLFAAADRNDSRILLIGDIGQLPSVGAGKVLKDMIDTSLVPTTELSVIYRQTNESLIVANSNNIKKGYCKLAYGEDFKLIECDDSAEISDKVVSEYIQAIKNVGIDNCVILSPIKNKGDCCTNALNTKIQEFINPYADGKIERKIKGIVFRTNDKIINLKNRVISDEKSSFDLCNGDTGYIRKIVKDADQGYLFTLEFTGNRFCVLREDDMHDVNLAYALTVHKSQGSEYKTVIMPLHMYMPQTMITRNLLYTAITRAKNKFVLVGQKKCVWQAVNNNTAYNRNTNLTEKIKYYFDLEKE